MIHILLAGLLSSTVAYSYNINPQDDLNTFGNNTLFSRWRPRFHFIAPSGWQNDPNGAMYDPTQDIYHLFYQFHPNHVDWGNISWGSAVSKDLVKWVDVRGWKNAEAQAISPGAEGSYDHFGVFTGTAQPTNLRGEIDGNLTIFYTSVNNLPIDQKAESQSMATSSDGGRTWEKYEQNPVISGPPEGWDVTGWRDPFFLSWPELDVILGQQAPHYYAVFGVGINGGGPRMPLYSAPATDLTNWTFLGPLLELSVNFKWGGDATKSGSFGTIFECPGAFSLVEQEIHGGNGKTAHYFINTGTQGDTRSWSLWAEGSITKSENGSAQFNILSSNPIDWGNLYAVSSFWDSKTSRRVVWGWSAEDMNEYGVKAQGFQGSMSMPREIFVQKFRQVIAPPSGVPLNTSASWEADQNGTYTVTTLGIRPLSDVVAALHLTKPATLAANPKSDHFHLKGTLANLSGEAGFVVRASPLHEEQTIISYSSLTNFLSVNRTSSSLITQFSSSTVNGYFVPYATATNGTESIEMDIFVDGSLVEVYLNNRFALTSRVYPSRDDALGIEQYVVNGSKVEFTNVRIWTEMLNVWPQRPLNSSSQLVWDTPEETDNGVWWSGI